MDFELYNDRQREFYRKLCRRDYPKFLYDLLNNPHWTVDFFTALYFFWTHNRNQQQWVVDKITPLTRRQIKRITSPQLRAITYATFQIVKDDHVRSQCLLSIFAVNENDVDAAVHIASRIADSLLSENFMADPHLPTLNLLLSLVISQELSRTWTIFIQAVTQGHAGAMQSFNCLFDFWAVNREVPKFVSIKDLPDGISKPSTLDDRLNIAVPDDCVVRCNEIYDNLTASLIPNTARLEELLQSFWSNRPAFQAQADIMWHTVVADASCDLQPGGHDGVAIDIQTLRDHGVRTIQLIPQQTRPDAEALFWFETPLTRRPFFTKYVIDSPCLNPELTEFDTGNLNDCVRSLYRYLAINGLWMICMGNFQQKHTAGSSIIKATTATRQTTPSRVHFRRIGHLGWVPSQQAISRCLEHYQGRRQPPEGKTFVKPEKVPQFNPKVGIVNDISIICHLREQVLAVPNSITSIAS